MTSITLSPIPITADIAAAFDKGQCDNVSHGSHGLKTGCSASKCILVKRDTHRWAIVHDEEKHSAISKVPYRWHSRYEAPVNMNRLASENENTATREMAKLVIGME